jgi:DNA-3-methyladenine glycosylase I
MMATRPSSNRQKIRAAIQNARGFVALQEEGVGFSDFLWDYVGGRPIQNSWTSMGELPAKTAESEAMSKALKKRGFNFVGPTICYAFMQAVGMVNDHVVQCFRHAECQKMTEG